METELQLYINQEDYMVADVVLLKKDKMTGSILDVILIESKLHSKVSLTTRQKELFDLVKRSDIGVVFQVRGKKRIFNGTPSELSISKDNIFKVVGEENGSLSNFTIKKY